MDYPIQIKAIRVGLSIIYFKGPQILIFQLVCISVPEYCFYMNKQTSVDHYEMPHYAAFHVGAHCLLKYPFMGFKYTKG